MVRTLLVSTPFMSVYRPNLALSLLRGVLLRAGYACEVLYTDLEFAREIGLGLYCKIAEKYPQEQLLGDLIFGTAIDGDYGMGVENDEPQSDHRHARGASRGLPKRKLSGVPDEFWEALPFLRDCARAFVDAQARRIAAYGPVDLVGFNLTFHVTPSLALAQRVRSLPGEPRIVFGGACCEGESGLAIHERFPWVDYVCRGEGEDVLLDLVRQLDHANPNMPGIDGLIWREGDRSAWSRPRALNVANLNAGPVPEFHDWLDQLDKSGLSFQREDLALPFEASRGCWYGEKTHCTFCGLVGPSLQFRSKNAARVRTELDSLAQYGIPRVDAADLILDHKFFNDLLPELRAEEHGLSIFFEVKANLTRAQVAILKQAGVDSLQPGIESLSTQVLRVMRKGAHAYHNVRLLKWLTEYGIDVHWNILYGFPGEDPIEYQRMAELIPLLMHLRPPMTGCTPVVLSRYSPLFFDAAKLGVTHIAPVASYQMVYGLRDREFIDRIAYFFDYEPADGSDAAEYIGPLRDAVDRWQSISSSLPTFEAHDDGERIHLVDERPIARTYQACLEGGDRLLWLACDGGVTVRDAANSCGLPESRCRGILERFCAAGWAVRLDGKFLSLAVHRTEDQARRSGLRKTSQVCV